MEPKKDSENNGIDLYELKLISSIKSESSKKCFSNEEYFLSTSTSSKSAIATFTNFWAVSVLS